MIFDKSAYDSQGNRIDHLVQYDYDVFIYIRGAEFESVPLVHFCDPESDEAYVVPASYQNGTLRTQVPNILLSQPKAITAFIYANIDNGFRSIYRVRINMVPRARPNDYVYPGTDSYIRLGDVLTQFNAIKAVLQDYLIVTDDNNGNVSLSYAPVSTNDDAEEDTTLAGLSGDAAHRTVTDAQIQNWNNNVTNLTTLENNITAGSEEMADYHLGFYLDENGDLCQKEGE